MQHSVTPTDPVVDEPWTCLQEAQLALVEGLRDRLLASGYRVTIGDYGTAPCVEVHAAAGRGSLVVVPLLGWALGEDIAAEGGMWEVAVRGADGGLVEAPGAEAPWGCPTIWDMRGVGMDLRSGLLFVEDCLALARDLRGFVPAVRDGFESAALEVAAYPELPYPGARPSTSYVQTSAGAVLPVSLDPARPSGFGVHDAGRVLCLDAWLAGQGAPPISARVPVLSFGSNACPSKIQFNAAHGFSLPAVNLRCAVADLAAVWCRDTRGRDGAVPATLVHLPGHREDHFLCYVTPQDVQALDRVKGRPMSGPSAYYGMVLLTSGSVIREDGTVVPDVACYVGTGASRWPLRDTDGRMLLVTRPASGQNPSGARYVPQHAAQQLVAQRLPTQVPDSVGAVLPGAAPDHAVPQLFVYGTLMPGNSRWHLLEPFTEEPPRRAHVEGTLVDTGMGFPALHAEGVRPVSGFVVQLQPRSGHSALQLLDRVEGVQEGLFTRDLTRVDGTLTWVYVAVHPSLRGAVNAQCGAAKMPDSDPSGLSHCHNLRHEEPAVELAAASSISL